MAPNPRIQIRLPIAVADEVRARLTAAEWPTIAEWFRHLLRTTESLVVPPPAQWAQLTVRLDSEHQDRLAALAVAAGVTPSRAAALLVEAALDAPFPLYPYRVPPDPRFELLQRR